MKILQRKQIAQESHKNQGKRGMFASVKSHMSSKRRQKISVGIFVAIAITITGLFAWQSVKAAPVVYNFGYTGTAQTFTAPEDGEYTFEAWGAQGGQPANKSILGGAGGYSRGEISLRKGDKIYVYVGEQRTNSAAAWNAGSTGGYGGGGATDFRLASGSWNDTASLRSRILVAGGGGGASTYTAPAQGGYGGGLVAGDGYNGKYPGNSYRPNIPPTGGTQVSGGVTSKNSTVYIYAGKNGSFGIGGNAHGSWGAGGGGGYFGGGGGGYTSSSVDSGAGGSSFISGYTGSVAIISTQSNSPRLASDKSTVCTPALAETDNKCSEHYSNYVFRNAILKAGNETFLSPTGADGTGHTGGGYARVTGETYTDNADKPTISSVSPNNGSTSGGQRITISGDNLDYIGAPATDGSTKTSQVLIGGNECIDVNYDGGNLSCTTSQSAEGIYDIIVYNGKRSTTLENGYTYSKTTIDAIVPDNGPASGGQEAVVFGNNFTANSKVYFGNTPAEIKSYTSSTITITTPQVTQPGERDVRVAGADQALAGGYTFISNIDILSISPDSGTNTGGYPVKIETSGGLEGEIDFVQVENGSVHSVGLDATGRVYTWGTNTSGVLGDGGASSYRATPELVGGILEGKRIISISSTGSHVLALDDQGKVYAWGLNNYYQLGNGTSTSSNVPINISGSGALAGKKIVKISAGNLTSAALDDQGKVYGWGHNGRGQLGTGNYGNSSVPVSPVETGVLSGKKIVDISTQNDSTSYGHTLAVDDQGKVYAWGGDDTGQLGNGSGGTSNLPIQISNGSAMADKKIVKVVAGYAQSYALDDRGEVFAWGYGPYGGLGTGSTVTAQTPVSLMESTLAGRRVVQISSSRAHTMALDDQGKVFAWGLNDYGQLGNGATTQSNIPVDITNRGALAGKKIMSVTAGYTTSLAVDDKGVYYAWGLNTSRQFGNNAATNSSSPLEVPRVTQNVDLNIKLGENKAEILSRTQNDMRIKAPAHATGAVDVELLVGDKTATSKTNGFTYTGEPKISNITPDNGPTPGGQEVKITTENMLTESFKGIPSNYIPVNYLNFTGTQYINSGVNQIGDTRVVADFQPNATGQQSSAAVFGIFASANSPWPSSSTLRISSGGSNAISYIYNLIGTNASTAQVLKPNTGQRSLSSVSSTGNDVAIYLDGKKTTLKQTTPSTAGNYFIGGANMAGSAAGSNFYAGKMYSMQMYKSGSLVRDFQPVRRASDGVFGMYDKATNTFFANNGTGTFTGGDDILKVSVGGSVCANPTINNGEITCRVSSHGAGKVDVTVSNGFDTVTLADGYEYKGLEINSVTPNSGPAAGGQRITIPGENLEVSPPPSAYTPIEYLNFTGTQYINTGVDQLNDPKVVVDFQADNIASQQGYPTMIGTRSLSPLPYPGTSAIQTAGSAVTTVRALYNDEAGTHSAFNMETSPDTNRHITELNHYNTTVTAKYDGKFFTAQRTLPTIATNYYIGTLNTANSAAASHYYKGKIFSIQIYKNGAPVRDFQPVRRSSDNVLGLYDKVNGVFYANNGTGTFGAGPVLPSNAYLGRVTVGGKVCTNATYENDEISCTTGPHAKGVVDVVVNNGIEEVTINDGYEYTMSVDTVTPNVGPIEGEQEITITGTNLQTPEMGYTAVDYLDFTGTQYINTGVTQVNNPKIRLDFQPNVTGQVAYATIFGVYGTGASTYYSGSAFRLATVGSTDYQYIYNNQSNTHTGAGGIFEGKNSGKRDIFEMDQNGQEVTLKLNDETKTVQQTAMNASYARNYYLGAVNTAGTTASMYRGKIFDMQMYENGSIVRDFQPARRNSDNVLGMYDKLNKVFYANNGTGTFGAGAVKPDAYLGTVKLGNSICTDPTIVSDGVITCTSSSSEPGVFDVTVDNTADTASLADSYEYLADNYLKTLTSSEGEISPSFDPNTLDYTLTLPVNKPCLTIEATANDASATITGTSDYCVQNGEDITVTVTAANGETRDYILKVVRPASSDDTLADLQIDGATIDGYDPATKTYQIEINDHKIREVEISYEKGHYFQTTAPDSGYKVSIEPGTTATDITVTSEDGSKTSTYTIILTQPHTTKLMSLSSDGSLSPSFDSDTMNYSMSVFDGVIGVNVDAVPFDKDATVTVTGSAYIPASGGVVTIKVAREGVEDSIYTINVTKESADIQEVYDFPYRGSVQVFVAPATAEYLFEAWGAQGGQPSNKWVLGGAGGYTSGKINLQKGDTFYVYVGEHRTNRTAAWNAGSTGGQYYSGGGATDFRLVSSAWNNTESLRGRVLVAGGGGGASTYTAPAQGGYGGGLVAGDGYNGKYPGNSYRPNIPPTGGTQVSGGVTSKNSTVSIYAGKNGSFGIGGNAHGSWGAAGGGGYFGGGGGGYTSGSVDSGAGGSSYISGHLGAVAVKSASETTPRLASDDSTVCTPELAETDEKCSEHYSEIVFHNTVVQNGTETFFSPTGTYETGHAGNGFARVTVIIPPSNDNTLSELSFTNSTLSPSYDPAAPEGTPYTLNVPSNQPIITTKAVANHKKATVTGDGEETILFADTPTEIVVSVVSESGLVREYTTTATRPADSNSKLNMLTMGSIPSGLCKNNGEYADYSCRFNDSNNNAVFFDSAVTDYYINVPTVSRKLNFAVDKGHMFQDIDASVSEGSCVVDNTNPSEVGAISCDGLPMGDNEIKITITAETGAKTTYTLHIFRTPGADIQNIEVVHPPEEDTDLLHFNPLATDYAVTGLPDTEETKFEVTVDSEVDVQVKFGENGSFEPCEIGENGKPVCEVEGLELKKNDIWIQATLNGMVKTYYINWYRQLNSNTFLEYLKVEDAQDLTEEFELSPTYEKTQDTYTAYVPFTTSEILISAEAERPDVSTVRGDTGAKSVTVGNNKFVIRVQAQDGSEGEYTLNVIRRADPNATVANIEASAPFTPNFDPETQNYIMDLDPHFSSIDFTKIEMESDVATYEIIGNSGLMPGVSEVVVRGVAADGTTKDYTFVVNMEPSSNTDLASLQATCNPYESETLSSAVNCQLVPDFNAEEAEYSMTVPGEVDTVTLSGTPADDLSTVSGLGEFKLATGTNEFNITVTAQDGSERIVTVTIERTEDNNNLLKSWTLKSGAESVDFGFEPTKNNYTATVENEISQLAVTALPLRSASQVTLGTNSPWKLDVGENEFTVTVIAENGETNEYTIEITRKPSSNVCLSKLTLQEARINPAFDCDTINYTAEVPFWITETTPLYTTAEPNATVEITGNKDLQVGDNEVKITVTAEDGTTTKEYTVVVNRHEDTEFSSRLVNLWTDTGDWNKPFAPETLYYEVDVASTVNQVKVGGIVEDIDGPATVEGLSTHTLQTGENIIQVVVTATDDSTTTYTLNVKRAPSTDASLKSLLLGRGSFAPSFKPDVLMYTMTADEGFVDFTALPRHDGATVKDADGNGKIRYPLEVGENTIDIEVTAEDGVTKKVYTVIVTRLVGINAQLSQLRVGDNMPLTPSFKESTSTYTVSNVSPTTDKINVYAKTRDSDSKVKISGGEYQVGETTSEVELDYGTNHIVVDVTAANGINTMQYVVTVIRNISGNNNLANLIPSIGTLSPSFSAGTMSYTLNVDYMTKQLNLEAIVQHENAHISYMAGAGYSASQNRKSVTRTINLTNEVTTVTVTVTAANGAAKSYTVQIRRNQNYPSTLDNLKVTPYDLDEVFNSTKLNYTVEVDYEIDAVAKLPINAIKSDPNATVTIGGGALSIGPNTVPITVVSRDGKSTTTYNLTVIRRSYSNNFLTYISTNQSTEIEPDFDKYNLSYSMTVGNTVSSISLSAEPENYNSSVKIGNASFTGQNAAYTWPVALNYGENVINITVTTSTNVKRVYKLTVTRELATSTDLSNVSFKAGSQSLEICDASETLDPETMSCAFTPAFSNEVDNYTVHVPAGTARGEINVTPANSLATVIGGGVVDLVAGHNEFTVTVRAQDGNEREITVDFVREALDINRIIELHVVPGAESGTSIEPNFTYDYDATAESPYIVRIPGRVSMIGFDVQLEDSLYSTVRGIESAPVPDGESTRQIVVKAENGDERVYNILLIKTPLDTNNFLDDLAVDGATVPGFNPTEKFYYDMGVVPNSKDKVEISALVTEPAKILPGGTGEIELASGDNNIQIRVQAENDEIRTYTVHIYRTPNDDNTLINIVIPKHTLTNPFKQYNTTYYVITSNKTTHASLNIQPILSSPNDASYKIEYMQPEFEVGSNLVKIIVTAENGDQMTYYIYVVLQNIDENYHLESLNTDIYELMEPTDPDAVAFSPTTFEYSFSVPMSQDRICVTARAESIQATILGAQDLANSTAVEVCYDLDVGINNIPVMVTAGNGVVKEYMLNVTREGTAGISKIVAVPEKRIPGKGNNNTWFLIEVVPAGQPYYKADNSGTNVVWDNKADILGGAKHHTNDHGVWNSSENGGVMPVAVAGGEYDVYFTGYSHLSKKKSNVKFLDGEPIEINFTYDEDTLADMMTAGTLSSDDPMYPLLAGDAGAASDNDLSCGPVIADCVTGGMFSGDEWGDDLVNSLDTSAILTKLYANRENTQKSLTDISKEDLDGNGQINSLDMSTTLNNLFRRGDK